MGNECNVAEDESISASIDESSNNDNYDEGYISTNYVKGIRGRNCIHPDINAGDDRFKIRDHIRQTQIECKGFEISENSMGKGLHKVFKAVVN